MAVDLWGYFVSWVKKQAQRRVLPAQAHSPDEVSQCPGAKLPPLPWGSHLLFTSALGGCGKGFSFYQWFTSDSNKCSCQLLCGYIENWLLLIHIGCAFQFYIFQWNKKILSFRRQRRKIKWQKLLTMRSSYREYLTRTVKLWGWASPLHPPTLERAPFGVGVPEPHRPTNVS